MSNTQELLNGRLFQSLAGLTFDSVMVTEATDDHRNSVIVYVNQAFTDMTGYGPGDVLGRTPGLLQGPKTEKAVTDQLSEDLENQRTFHGKTVNYRKDGSPFNIEWKVTPMVTAGKTTHFVAVQREIA